MRVGLDGRCIQDHFPGIGRYAYNLSLQMARAAPELSLVLFYDPRAQNTRHDLSALEALPNMTMRPVDLPILSLRSQLALPRLARAERLDLFHSPYYVMPYAMPCPTVVTLHDLIPSLYPESLPRARLAPLFVLLQRLALWRAKGILVDSQATAEDVHSMLGAPISRLTVAPLGVEERFRPVPEAERTQMRERLGLRAPYILYLGINKPHKNLVRLIEAWAGLRPSERGACWLVLAGPDDPRYSQPRQAVVRLGLTESVRFVGEVADEDLPGLYAGAQAFVLPSLYEGFGLPVLEAMACGAPVACSRTSSLPEIVGDAALTFDPLSVPRICGALGRLLTEPGLRQRLSVLGQERAARFTWRRTAEATLALYRHIARG
jgi:glycosyltransferase involved in cell wall biosynthesis